LTRNANSASVGERRISRSALTRTIHLVLDNLNTHCPKSLDGYFGAEHANAVWERFTVHYTPKHASWLNQAEVEISLFSRQCLGKRGIPNLATLRSQTKAWNQSINLTEPSLSGTFLGSTHKDASNIKQTYLYGHSTSGYNDQPASGYCCKPLGPARRGCQIKINGRRASDLS
jgi:hypothetical protein